MSIAITGTMATAAPAAPSASDLKKQIDTASNQLEDITESYNKLNIDLKKTAADEKALEASIGPTKAKLLVAQGQVNTIASNAYMQGRIGPMSALLGSDPGGLVERLSYLDAISRANQRDIDDYTNTTATFDERKAELKTAEAKQAAQLKAMDARKKTIEANIKKLRAMRVQLYGSATETGQAGAAGPAPAISGKAGIAVDFAYEQANKPAYYGYGDSGPDKYDCSGLTMAAWAKAGKSLPHNAAAQYSATARISRSQLQAGDLVFYRSLGHVGLYVGGGMIIDASREGEPIKKRSIDIMTPYGYGRVR
ncbi:NlpC/P60 family protein [Actinoplanes sp. KI2]|uniref:C40 family peptidase n=1 Tax=Actinoplanes sp. KI2 TaxID=2983315 RepID=UPI0021D59B77|nr:C40 family peptidase [Actinoplanes sp. KI2]MCU7722940.1 NlpC/P60 family protein [Actinoplanes sp. KI2]